MGRKGTTPGVEGNGGSLRIRFTLEGEPRREPVGLTDTPANRKRAAKLRQEIVDKIRAGLFTYAEYFPNSPRANGAGAVTFATAAQEWLLLQANLAKSTQYGYQKILNTHWMPPLGQRALRAITPGEIKRIALTIGKAAKTHNNAISVVKMVLDYAVGEKYLEASPAAALPWRRRIPTEPDPFTLPEVRQILDWMVEHEHPQSVNYFRYAFFSGARPSELIALKWPKVDFRRGEARIDEAQVLGLDKPTKTYERRYVEMNSQSRAALEAQKQHTYLAYRHVFLDPLTGAPYVNDKPPRLVLQRALKALGIRHRGAKQTRHTFATAALVAGALPPWIARQLGHKTVQITLTVYAKWIEGADQGRERAKLEVAIGESLGESERSQGRTG